MHRILASVLWCAKITQRIVHVVVYRVASVQWSPPAAVAVAFALGLLIGQACRPHPTADARAWDRRVQQLLADSSRVHRQADQLRGTVRQLGHRADTLTRRADRAAGRAAVHAGRADSLAAALSAAAGVRDSLTALEAAYVARSAEASEWRVAYEDQLAASARLREAAGLATAQADSLQGRVRGLELALGDRPTPRPCRVLGLVDCPSRGAVFVAGLATGLVLTMAGR